MEYKMQASRVIVIKSLCDVYRSVKKEVFKFQIKA